MRTTFITSMLVAFAAAGNEPNPPTWDTDRVIIIDPSDADCQSRVDKIFTEMGGVVTCDNGQFSDSRYALMFKPGNHACNVNVGYYTQILGLGDTPNDTVISELHSPDTCGYALDNFWRGVENVELGHEQTDVDWHVSQASPMRRTRIVGDITLGTGYSSGGYLANSEITGTLNAGSQQQWFTRNSSMGEFANGAWNFVFVGCEGAPATNCGKGGSGIASTNIAQTPIIAEKPYITIDSNGKYTLHRPVYKKYGQGHDFIDGADLIDFSEVYVASASDSAQAINAKLSTGMHVLLQPGVYNLDEALKVSHDGQVLLGIGMASLVSANGNACVEVADGVDARIAGLLLEAGQTKSDSLLKWGDDQSKGNESAPGVISDVFARVGGRNDSTKSEVTTERMIQINNSHVIIDHTWLWRADHDIGGLVKDSKNYVAQGLQVNADNVKAYGLFSEHSLGDLVEWNGNHGEVYFYQSELPYDVTQENYADAGFCGFKVTEASNFQGYGIAVYTYFRDNTVWMPSAIQTPNNGGIYFTNSYSRYLNGNGGIKHLINGQGNGVQESSRDSYLCSLNPYGEEMFTQTNRGAELFLN